MAEQKQLSLCIITKNDASFFPACLEDMDEIADEMLVIDLGSEDRTTELARQSGAAVYQPEWEDDFSKIENFCMDHAAGKWVLFLQADEVISHEQLKELKLLLQNPGAEGYLIDVDDRQKEQAVSSPTQFLRLIRNRKNYRFQYRSFAYIPEEELYSLQSSGLRITHRGGKNAGWQTEERKRLLQKDLTEHPQNGYLWYLKGIELLNQEKYKESAASLELARQTFVGGYLYVPHLYKCLGICLLSLGRNKEAEEVLNVGFWLFPFYTDLLVLRAELYRQLDRNEEALKDLETCLALQKGSNACVPKPEIDLSVTGEMLEDIRASLNGKP
jgi:glycosyltransferase involved in cell wall biosynthesis